MSIALRTILVGLVTWPCPTVRIRFRATTNAGSGGIHEGEVRQIDYDGRASYLSDGISDTTGRLHVQLAVQRHDVVIGETTK